MYQRLVKFISAVNGGSVEVQGLTYQACAQSQIAQTLFQSQENPYSIYLLTYGKNEAKRAHAKHHSL